VRESFTAQSGHPSLLAKSGGEKPLDGATQDSVVGFDSPFEQSVAEAFEQR
jgi:hypothetical protein